MNDRLRRVIAAELGFPIDQVHSTTSLGKDLGLDHFDGLELLDALEAEFGVAIPASASAEFRTLADMERYLLQMAPRALKPGGRGAPSES
ncbi:MAG: hypothetical protein JRH16_11090 [Deltaproteobacteria bacterium]|nr:hypothetical protein [Deltaproteobacteria bacterium]